MLIEVSNCIHDVVVKAYQTRIPVHACTKTIVWSEYVLQRYNEDPRRRYFLFRRPLTSLSYICRDLGVGSFLAQPRPSHLCDTFSLVCGSQLKVDFDQYSCLILLISNTQLCCAC